MNSVNINTDKSVFGLKTQHQHRLYAKTKKNSVRSQDTVTDLKLHNLNAPRVLCQRY